MDRIACRTTRTGFIAALIILLVAANAQAAIRVPVSAPESRYVWVSGMNTNINFTPMNFDGFYYDLDSKGGGETLSIILDNPADRSIKKNNVTYSTSIETVPFKYRAFGNYNVILFLGETYFAGYTEGSKIARAPVNLVNRSLFGKILVDENKVHTVTNGGNLPLNEEYALNIRILNITARTVQVTLMKHGDRVDSRAISAGNTYVFEKDIRTVISGYSYIYDKQNITIGNLPIIAVHIDSVFEDNETGVIINGIFQLSDVYTSVDPGFGIMKITNISDTGITMTNIISMTLSQRESTAVINGIWYTFSQGGTYDLMGDIKLKVADSDNLMFYLYKESIVYGNLERRGAVYTEATPITAWDALNFAGFWYDLDSDSYSESLEITNLTGRSIPEGGLKYTAFGVEIPFAYPKIAGAKPGQLNGSYKVFCLGTNKYAVINDSRIKLSKILVAHGANVNDKKTLMDGETWEMGEGYNLTVKSVDTRSYPRRVHLVLSKNSVELDEKWLSQGYFYSYSGDKPPGENDLPLFITYLDAVFSGCCSDMIQLRYTWLISSNVTEIHDGDSLGVFKVMRIEPDHIELRNEKSMNLTAGSNINLIGNLGFAVANSDELRFYPSNNISHDAIREVISDDADVTDKEKILEGTLDATPIGPKIPGYGFVMTLSAFLAIFLLRKLQSRN